MSSAICPYCEYEEEVCNDDGWAMDDSKEYTIECAKCKMYYLVSPFLEISYLERKSCEENLLAHDFEEFVVDGKLFDKCKHCGKVE